MGEVHFQQVVELDRALDEDIMSESTDELAALACERACVIETIDAVIGISTAPFCNRSKATPMRDSPFDFECC